MPSVTAMTERVGCSVQGCKEQADALLTPRSIRQKWASPSEVQGVLRTNERRVAMRPGTQTRKATDETRSSVGKLRVSDEVSHSSIEAHSLAKGLFAASVILPRA